MRKVSEVAMDILKIKDGSLDPRGEAIRVLSAYRRELIEELTEACPVGPNVREEIRRRLLRMGGAEEILELAICPAKPPGSNVSYSHDHYTHCRDRAARGIAALRESGFLAEPASAALYVQGAKVGGNEKENA